MDENKLLSRKFILSVIAEVGLLALFFFDKIGYNEFATLFSAVVLGYGVLNVAQKAITKE